jgi:DNA primase
VIGLDRAGIGEVVAPNGTAVTEHQLERMWRLEPAPILCFDGDAAGQKAAIRAATRALPHLGPERTLRFAELPPGQDPDDLVKSGGKDAFEAVIAKAEPLSDRLYRHEREAQPLTTPEARAGLRQRLLAHASAIGDQALARLYRDEWLSRFDAEVGRRTAEQRPSGQRFMPQRRGSFVKGRWVPPEPPLSDEAKGISSTGIDGRTARALLVGFANFPDALIDSAEQLAALPIADPKTAKLRNELVHKAFSGEKLDREALSTIFTSLGVASGTPSRGAISFSFTRADTDPERASADLASAIEALRASEEVERALLHATERFKEECSEEAFEEQQRLMEAKRKLNERLASLAGTD